MVIREFDKYAKSFSAGVVGVSLVFVLLLTNAFAQESASLVENLSFSGFCREVVAYYPVLKRQQARVEQVLAQKQAAATGFWPRLSASVSVTSGDDPVYVFGSLLRQEEFKSANFELDALNTPRHHENYNFSLQAQMPLFDAFQTILKVRSGEHRLKAAYETEAFVRMEGYLLAADAYLHARALEQLVKITADVLSAAENDLKQAEELKDKGVVLGADFFAARVLRGQVQKSYDELLRQNVAMQALLNILRGKDYKQPFVLVGETSILGGEIEPLDRLLSAARKNRPDLRSLEEEYNARTAEVKGAKSSFLPQVTAFGTASEDREEIAKAGGKNFVAGVKGEMPLFDPGYNSRVKEANAGLAIAEQEQKAALDKTAADLVTEYNRYLTLQENFQLTATLAQDAQKAVEMTVPLYREGRKSIAELLETRLMSWQTAQDLIQLKLAEANSGLRLLFLSGQLSEAQINSAAVPAGGAK